MTVNRYESRPLHNSFFVLRGGIILSWDDGSDRRLAALDILLSVKASRENFIQQSHGHTLPCLSDIHQECMSNFNIKNVCVATTEKTNKKNNFFFFPTKKNHTSVKVCGATWKNNFLNWGGTGRGGAGRDGAGRGGGGTEPYTEVKTCYYLKYYYADICV